MGFFARDWIDRLLGRGRDEPGEESGPHASPDLGSVEDGATAARDDTLRESTPPQKPPETG